MKIEITNLKTTIKALEDLDKQTAKAAIRKTTQKMWENTRFFAKPHFKKGNQLEKNIRHKIKDETGIVWIDDANMLVNWRGKINYVKFILYGTKPHTIKPKTKKALRFYYKNLDKFIFSKTVHHPGYKGDNFLKKAIQKTFSQLDTIFKGV